MRSYAGGFVEWLDIDQTTNRSYNEMLTQLGAGGDFEGWRYATDAEWDAMRVELGIATYGGGGYPVQSAFDAATFVHDMMGYTRNSVHSGYGETWGTLGMLETSSDLYVRYYQFTRTHYTNPDLNFGNPYGASFSPTTFDSSNGPSRDKAYETRGSFLVRAIGSGDDPPVRVPEPATGWLFGLGLVALLLGRERRRGIPPDRPTA